MEDDEVSPTLEDFVAVYQGNKSAITLGQFYLKCTHPAGNLVPQGKKLDCDWEMKWVIARGLWGKTVLVVRDVAYPSRLIDTGFWKVSLNLPDMAHSGLKVPNKVNSTIKKGFRNMELSFLDPVPKTKLVKRELLASFVGGDVDLVGVLLTKNTQANEDFAIVNEGLVGSVEEYFKMVIFMINPMLFNMGLQVRILARSITRIGNAVVGTPKKVASVQKDVDDAYGSGRL
ncbi:hypothetical protein QYF36_007461 [Acer negundo]|nr:hypothetical protein QYF36_007461 [Acer negundo]